MFNGAAGIPEPSWGSAFPGVLLFLIVEGLPDGAQRRCYTRPRQNRSTPGQTSKRRD